MECSPEWGAAIIWERQVAAKAVKVGREVGRFTWGEVRGGTKDLVSYSKETAVGSARWTGRLAADAVERGTAAAVGTTHAFVDLLHASPWEIFAHVMLSFPGVKPLIGEIGARVVMRSPRATESVMEKIRQEEEAKRIRRERWTGVGCLLEIPKALVECLGRMTIEVGLTGVEIVPLQIVLPFIPIPLWGPGDILTFVQARRGRNFFGEKLDEVDKKIYYIASAIPLVPARPIVGVYHVVRKVTERKVYQKVLKQLPPPPDQPQLPG